MKAGGYTQEYQRTKFNLFSTVFFFTCYIDRQTDFGNLRNIIFYSASNLFQNFYRKFYLNAPKENFRNYYGTKEKLFHFIYFSGNLADKEIIVSETNHRM